MKYLYVFALICMLSSCEQAMDMVAGKDVYDHIESTENTFSTLNDARYWVATNIKYKVPSPYEWQSPVQTEEMKTGSCIDFASLILWYAVTQGLVDEERSFVRGVETEKGTRHAIVVLDGVEYEPQVYFSTNIQYKSIVAEYTLEEVLNKIHYTYGNRSIEDMDIYY